MARTVITQLVDDIDGQPAAETIRFALDGTLYEIRGSCGLRAAS